MINLPHFPSVGNFNASVNMTMKKLVVVRKLTESGLTVDIANNGQEKFMSMQMDEYLSKPVDPNKLLKCIHFFMEQKNMVKPKFSDNIKVGEQGEIIFSKPTETPLT